MSPTELAYKQMAAAGASGFGLLIALCDSLADDLRLAAEAERRNDIEGRCRILNHALTVLAYLEDRVERGPGGELADQLTGFYRSVRRQIVVAQAQRSAEMLEQQLARVLELRKTWQEAELRAAAEAEESAAASQSREQSGDQIRHQSAHFAANPFAAQERVASSWSA